MVERCSNNVTACNIRKTGDIFCDLSMERELQLVCLIAGISVKWINEFEVFFITGLMLSLYFPNKYGIRVNV